MGAGVTLDVGIDVAVSVGDRVLLGRLVGLVVEGGDGAARHPISRKTKNMVKKARMIDSFYHSDIMSPSISVSDTSHSASLRGLCGCGRSLPRCR